MNRIKWTLKWIFNTLGYGIAKKDNDKFECPSLGVLSQDMVKMADSCFSNSFPISPHCGLTQKQIKKKIRNYFWHYPFRFGEIFVDADKMHFKGLHGRHYQRYCHIFPAVLSVAGGSLSGKTVLEIGCNAGFWAIQARLCGSDSVLGVDLGTRNIEQANFILRLTGLDGIEYRVVNAYDICEKEIGKFDITFFLGLLYHVDKPIDALERLYDVTRLFSVIDTTLARSSIPANIPVLKIEEDIVHDQNVSNKIAMVPSKSAVPLMLKHVGFREVFWVQNVTKNLPLDYSTNARRTFIAIK